jgi:hypothetical protein
MLGGRRQKAISPEVLLVPVLIWDSGRRGVTEAGDLVRWSTARLRWEHDGSTAEYSAFGSDVEDPNELVAALVREDAGLKRELQGMRETGKGERKNVRT